MYSVVGGKFLNIVIESGKVKKSFLELAALLIFEIFQSYLSYD